MKQPLVRRFTNLALAILLIMPLCTGCSQPVEDALAGGAAATPDDGSALPFPPVPTASVAGPTLAESTHVRRAEPHHLADDAPNVLIIMLDDVGFGLADTFGGEIRTPTLTRLAEEGIRYNCFHTTAICSPTRAALLTGRNHHRVGFGTIAERAADWDGYVGVIPHTSATLAEVLGDYGYHTSAFGKWHNTPAVQTTAMGPFDRWPTGHGFDYFYGFLAGESSQYEPRLYENLNPIEPPDTDDYHLSADMADQAIHWLREHRAYAPDQPFLMYWAPGAGHGPHHIFAEWADKYKGQFDDGWDAMQQRIFERQKELGWIPADAELPPRPEGLSAWEDIPQEQRAFQLRLMEIFAGYVEHADAQAGRGLDELERQGIRENTVVVFIWGDNGSSAEGQRGTLSELLAQNQVPTTIEEQLEVLESLGGLEVLGTAKTDNMYHAAWAWAGDAPFRNTKLVASHFGGTRTPLVISWPGHIAADVTPRSQFHHVNDIAPTIYEIAGITPPETVGGIPQDPLDGVSMVYTFEDAEAPGEKDTQYFECYGSRGIYHDGWYACTFGPLVPWETEHPGLATWDPNDDVWELYNLADDFTQAHDLAADEPERLEQLKKLFLEQAEANQAFPIGGSLLTRIDPSTRITSPYTSWVFDASTRRMPEFTAPGLGRQSNTVTIDLEVGENASGVLYALGGNSGGVTLYLDEGHLCYEYNMLLIERTKLRSEEPLAAGEHTITVETTLTEKKAMSPADVVLSVDSEVVASGTVARTVPAAFTASETFDVGVDLGSPVALDYAERAPFEFDGTIDEVRVELAQ